VRESRGAAHPRGSALDTPTARGFDYGDARSRTLVRERWRDEGVLETAPDEQSNIESFHGLTN